MKIPNINTASLLCSFSFSLAVVVSPVSSAVEESKGSFPSWMKTAAASSALQDLVQELPGYGPPPTTQFSGYLDASAGCDLETNGPLCQLHYWFALAETDAASAPVVLWLNGGPGSSSILGFVQELGPLLMNATGGFLENPYAWTKYANVLVLEAPMGVGYSYCSRQINGQPCVNTDRYTASASRAALVDFFTTKFPELASNDFYITGESYAGVYIPTLAKEVLDNASDYINLKGIAVGDPCTDTTAQADSMDSLWYAHKYGLVDDEIYDLLWNTCQIRHPNLMMRQGGIHLAVAKLNQELLKLPKDDAQRRAHAERRLAELIPTTNKSPECRLAYRKFLMSSSHGLSQSWNDMYIDDYSLFAPVSNLEDEQMAAYLSRADVREALHVEKAPTATWPYASVGFDYTSEYDACNWDNVIVQKSMVDFYQEIVPQLEKTWVYNGDTDPCVSYEGTRLAVKQILRPELDGGSYRPWFYNQTAASLELLADKAPLFGPNLVAQNMGAQFGGEVTDYEEGLKFVTFHGSGHMVPQFRPQAALHFLKHFLNGDDDDVGLSPLLPKNETLQSMSDDEFDEVVNDWTEAAMGPPYV
jgi:serine carboxypeptidase-like clade 1